MRRRRQRWGQIAAITVSLAFALFGVWYRAFVSTDGVLAQGGVLGLVSYLCCQLLLNAENEIAIEVLNHRVDRVEACARRVADAVGVADECDDSGWGA